MGCNVLFYKRYFFKPHRSNEKRHFLVATFMIRTLWKMLLWKILINRFELEQPSDYNPNTYFRIDV